MISSSSILACYNRDEKQEKTKLKICLTILENPFIKAYEASLYLKITINPQNR